MKKVFNILNHHILHSWTNYCDSLIELE